MPNIWICGVSLLQLAGTLRADGTCPGKSAGRMAEMPASAKDIMLMKKTAEQKRNICRVGTDPQHGIKAPGAIRSAPRSLNSKDVLPKFQKDILRRYEEPLRVDGWLHKELNH